MRMITASGEKLLSSSVVGDGGASWRLKALKRAREQAARGELWGSLGQLAVSVASRTAAPSRAHIHAIRDRKRGLIQEQHTGSDDQRETYIKKQEVEKIKQGADDNSIGMQNEGSSSRHIMRDRSVRQKKDEDDADMYLARKIMHNKKYTTYGQADDEYDFEDGPSKKDRKKGGGNEQQGTQKSMRLLTQQERCLFCFENPNMPKHLIVSIANFTYLMLPHWQSVVPGHCYIVPQQHESATRTVENNVWEEIRNFKKCLIMMFAKQEKDVVFLETVMGLAQQCCHCLIECIPLPKGIAKQAPLYFKKAIDEAEDEWSQHNAKKLIDTSEKGLQGCIPKNFPYFHVEFGLHKGLVHVIDDEEQFKSSLGLNVIRGMLHLPEEDMYSHRRYESVEVQREAVKSFLQDWEPFDWTTQLHQVS
ncbi:CWF19-like protein 2 [Morella rubra]|uniref:CWF19-like protein 2 n=1 Tax=Morella rubra TaxID=262757 RepID=A0A6A1V303_9ROSI|nr:CWF19-like protein 2 [Morella rubra]